MERENVEEYLIPKACEECGSENIKVRVLYDKQITRYLCMDCSMQRSIAKVSNLKRRNNTTLNRWASSVVNSHPFCSICGSKENLEAHHIIPVAHLPELSKLKYAGTNGMCLCKKCHFLVHHKATE